MSGASLQLMSRVSPSCWCAKQASIRVLPSSKLHVSKATQDGKATHDRKIHHAAIIAVNPDSKERFLALWSRQLVGMFFR